MNSNVTVNLIVELRLCQLATLITQRIRVSDMLALWEARSLSCCCRRRPSMMPSTLLKPCTAWWNRLILKAPSGSSSVSDSPALAWWRCQPPNQTRRSGPIRR